MREERHYTEAEIARIFEKATEIQQSGSRRNPGGEGLTLNELQEVASSVGLDPAAVARAVSLLDHDGRTDPRRSFLGIPIGVGYEVDLAAPLSDEAWGRLVTDARRTFNAGGQISESGPLRQWSNGNLQMLAEPGPSGQRLRMQTLDETMRIRLRVATGLVTAMTLLSVILGIDGEPLGSILTMVLIFGIAAAGMFGSAFFKSRWWAPERERQFEALGERAAELSLGSAHAEPSAATVSGGDRLSTDLPDEGQQDEGQQGAARRRRTRG